MASAWPASSSTGPRAKRSLQVSRGIAGKRAHRQSSTVAHGPGGNCRRLAVEKSDAFVIHGFRRIMRVASDSGDGMELGMIGLGRMGGNMAQRLLRGGHRVVGFDPDAEARAVLEGEGGRSAASLPALVAALPAPRGLL